jgi:tight adherence protein C
MLRRVSHAGVAALALINLFAAGVAHADDPVRLTVDQLDASEFPTVRVIASATDASGRAITGVTGGDLHVTESGMPQTATIELAAVNAPVTLALALDTSGSMAGAPFAAAKAAIASMLERLGPSDRAALITFATTARVAHPLTGDTTAVVNTMSRTAAGGNTAVYDGLVAALDAIADAPADSRRAVVLLTDGVDTSSSTSRAAAVARAAAARHPIYVVALGTSFDHGALEDLAAAVPGGQVFPAATVAQLAGVYDRLAARIRTQLAITYRSTAIAADGSTLPLTLTLLRDGAAVGRATISYQVPAGRGTAPSPTASPDRVVAPHPSPAIAVARESESGTRSMVVALLGAATILTFLLWVSEVAALSPERERRRLQHFVRRLAVTTTEHKRRSIIQRIIVPTFRTVGRPLLRITPAGMLASTRQRLLRAGEPMGLGPAEFLGVRTGFALLGAVVLMLTLTLFSPGATLVFVFAPVGAMLGYAIPGVVIDSFGRGRRQEIQRSLPAALDMIALSVEAGLSFDGAIAQVANRWNTPLSEELRRLLLEFQMGRDRRQAMREMAERSGVPDLVRFTNAIAQADTVGVPLVRVVQEQSGEMRTRRRQRAEEQARVAPVKMLFPMVLLIFPALFVVILGPAIPLLMDIFNVSY